MTIKTLIQILIYVLLSSFGLVMLKLGTSHALEFSIVQIVGMAVIVTGVFIMNIKKV